MKFLPPLHTDPVAGSGPGIYTFSQDRLPDFKPAGIWIVAGLSNVDAVLPVGAYWVRQFDQAVPAGVNNVDGFDAESFFACLLEALDEFPPRAVLSTPSRPQCAASGERTPAKQLREMLYSYSQEASQRAATLFKELTTSFTQSRPISDARAFAERIEQTAELSARLGGAGRGSSLAPFMEGLAEGQTPRVADGFLERAERLYRTTMGTERAAHLFPQIASVLCRRAKLHSSDVADRMYAEADQLMARAKSGTKAGEVTQLTSWAEMLADWADIKPQEDEATALFDAVLEKLETALSIPIEKFWANGSDHSKVRLTFAHLVERRARKLGAQMPARYFDAAREHWQKIIE
jgi:hypothetical protein